MQSRARREASRWLAEDALQDACERLLSRGPAFATHPNPRAYAIKAMASALIDQRRRQRREVLASDLPEVPTTPLDCTVEAAWEAERMLAGLPSGQSSAVRLVDVEGYTIDQAAEILGVHRGTVSRARLRGLQSLRRTFFPHESYERPA
ncbi:RNA polymerase sigma factor [Streptomyces sp. N35]|uniref:RNA polymerase sigma factor n=1 Tax=Streptomyces sp. N35 TaxID=2795730 RepID=UPI0018F5DBBE|nr:RNA polymerase sigma factor [Streptomyces sp. N35]